MKPPEFLRALSSRNYRLYFGGQCVSLMGTWMTSTAATWLVYALSGSAFDIGLVFFASMVPVFLFAPLAGVAVDRVDALKVVRVTQALSLLQSAAMAAFTFSHHMTVPALCWLSAVQGMINAVDFPARQTLTPQLAGERELLNNVIALNSITFNLARLVGPAVAGFVIHAWGAGACFTVDAVSYLAVLAALFAVDLPPRPARKSVPHPLHDLRDGLRYTWSHPEIRRILSLVFVISLLGFAHSVLAPVYARDVYGGDARTLGFILSATGLGAVLGGIFLGAQKTVARLVPALSIAAFVGGAGLILIGAIHIPWSGLIAFGLAGMGAIVVMVGANTLVQLHVEEEKRGRVMSLFTATTSVFPFGSLIIGGVAGCVGPHWTMALCGTACLGAGLWFAQGKHEAPAG